MKYDELQKGHPLLTNEGAGHFERYKAGNWKDQNVLVKLIGRPVPKWFTEAKLNKENKEK